MGDTKTLVEPVAWRWTDGGGYNAGWRYSDVDPRDDTVEVFQQGAERVGRCEPLVLASILASHEARIAELEEALLLARISMGWRHMSDETRAAILRALHTEGE